jgi:hypothetical protein
MKLFKRGLLSLAIAAVLGAGVAQAQVSDNVIKIGVLSDMSSLYTDLAGAGSVVAARLAVEGLGIERRGYKSSTSPPTTRTSRTSARRSRASGTTPTRST